jgi:hypothetical protein
MRRHRFACVVVLLCSGLAVTARAQTDFARLPLKTGDEIYVTEPTGATIAGRVTTVSAAALFVDGREFRPQPGLRIERHGDPVWDGAAIGVLSGFALGVLTGLGECGVDLGVGQCALAGAAWGGVLGLLIDWRHRGRTLIYVGVDPPAGQAPVSGSAPPSRSIRIGGTFRY